VYWFVVGSHQLGESVSLPEPRAMYRCDVMHQTNKLIGVEVCDPVFLHFFSIPLPRFPSPSLFPSVAGDAVAIAILDFAMLIALGKLFAKNYKYEIDSNQVMFFQTDLIYVLYMQID